MTSANGGRWQLNFVFKAPTVHWFYLKHWNLKSINIARVTTDPSPSLKWAVWSFLVKPPMIRAPPCAASIENRDCTVRRCLLTGFFTFDVIVVNWSGCVRWGCQTWTGGGGEGSPRAWHCSSWRVRVFINHASFFSGRGGEKAMLICW